MDPVYTAIVKNPIKNEHGWDSYLISVLKDGVEVGTYERNYGLLKTFFPFCQDGEWYALYSKDYTATRVMKLPECIDLGGEEDEALGFCPMEYYVPFGEEFEVEIGKNNETPVVRDRVNGKIGFVAGCIWGDDSSAKIEFLDLSEVKNGIIKRDDRFGYHELPRADIPLKDLIYLTHDCNDEHGLVQIATFRMYNLWDNTQKPFNGFYPLECEEETKE